MSKKCYNIKVSFLTLILSLSEDDMKLLYRELIPKKGKDYAEMILFSDLHYGAPNCMLDKAKEQLEYCRQKGIYVYTNGDLTESATRYSIGDSVYHQLNPQDQMDFVVELLKPLAKDGLLLNIGGGNHEARIAKETGIDISKIMAKELGVPYTGDSIWSLFRVGKQNYSMYALHGSSGAKFSYTKLKSVIDVLHSFDADIVAQGHVHELMTDWYIKQCINLRNKTVEEKKMLVILTGGYLSYSESYASSKGLPITKTGSPKLELCASVKEFHCSQ